MDIRHELASTTVQAAPAAALVGVHVAGMTLPEWAAVTGMLFIVFQALHLLWVWRRELKDRKP